MAKATCQNCDRTVLIVEIAGERVATDPELIMVVTARHEAARAGDDGTGRIAMARSTTWARRVHADLCEAYKSSAAREKLQREQREYNRRNGRPRTPRRNDGL